MHKIAHMATGQPRQTAHMRDKTLNSQETLTKIIVHIPKVGIDDCHCQRYVLWFSCVCIGNCFEMKIRYKVVIYP